jgi:hypothetical protein
MPQRRRRAGCSTRRRCTSGSGSAGGDRARGGRRRSRRNRRWRGCRSCSWRCGWSRGRSSGECWGRHIRCGNDARAEGAHWCASARSVRWNCRMRVVLPGRCSSGSCARLRRGEQRQRHNRTCRTAYERSAPDCRVSKLSSGVCVAQHVPYPPLSPHSPQPWRAAAHGSSCRCETIRIARSRLGIIQGQTQSRQLYNSGCSSQSGAPPCTPAIARS